MTQEVCRQGQSWGVAPGRMSLWLLSVIICLHGTFSDSSREDCGQRVSPMAPSGDWVLERHSLTCCHQSVKTTVNSYCSLPELSHTLPHPTGCQPKAPTPTSETSSVFRISGRFRNLLPNMSTSAFSQGWLVATRGIGPGPLIKNIYFSEG